MIITRDSDFHQALSHLEWIFRCRKYPQKLIQTQFEKVLSMTQRDVLSKSRKEEEDTRKLVFSIPFSEGHSKNSEIIRINWHNIENDPDLSRIWVKPPMVATKRHNNLN